MIFGILVTIIWNIISWILSFFNFPVFNYYASVLSYISLVFNDGAAMLFFFIRPNTFLLAVDVLVWLWTGEHLYFFILWVLRKLPWLGIE